MSVNNSYFSKNNTIFLNSYQNTGQEPVAELVFGLRNSLDPKYTYSRFIFDLDLNLLTEKINDGIIQTGCSSSMTHTLIMTNTTTFEKSLLT